MPNEEERASALGPDELKDLEAMEQDFTAEELEEFLAADHLETSADPLFRERLRQKLWEIVRSRFGSRRGGRS